jgi:hypothetical protein
MEPWTFVHVADIQPGSPKSFRYCADWWRNWLVAKVQIQALHPDLVLVGGDLTRDGNVHRFELEEMRAELAELGCPVHVVPGNMDTGNKHAQTDPSFRASPGQYTATELNVTSGQLRQFASVYGPLWWSFDHKSVRFSGFADMVVNSGLPEEEQFWRWAAKQAARPRPKHHVWIMHYALFSERPDEPNWEITDPDHYLDWYFTIDQPGRQRLLDLFRSTATSHVISGHIHCRRTVRAEGIRFDYAPSTGFGQWGSRWADGDDTLGLLHYRVSDEGIDCRFVPLVKTFSGGPRYGLGAHPRPERRDYAEALDPRFARTLKGHVPALAEVGTDLPPVPEE